MADDKRNPSSESEPDAETGLDAGKQLQAIEARIRRAIEALKQLRNERDTARAETEKLRAALHERGETLRQLEEQILSLQTDREDTRAGVEKLLAQIDALEKEFVS